MKQHLQFGESQAVDEVLLYLHERLSGRFAMFIHQQKGSQEDAEDVFQDGLVVLYNLSRQGKLEGVDNIEPYLLGICKKLWYKLLLKKKQTVELSREQEDIPVEDVQLFGLLTKERQATVLHLLNKIGEDCQRLLTYYYYDNLRMVKIAELMKLANDQVAKSKKSDCMRKLRKLVSEKYASLNLSDNT